MCRKEEKQNGTTAKQKLLLVALRIVRYLERIGRPSTHHVSQRHA
jgi:hypothetical protein